MIGRFPASLLVLSLVLSACSGPADPSGIDRRGETGGADGVGEAPSDPEAEPGNGNRGELQVTSEDEPNQGPEASGAEANPGGAAPASVRPGISSVRDPLGDPESGGDVPAWVDLTGAEIREVEGGIRVRAHLAAVVPGRMPDPETVTVVQFALKPPKGRDIFLYAEGTSGGWAGYFSRGDRRTELPGGRFSRDGNALTWSVPWGQIGNPRRLDWAAHLGWSQTTALKVNYAFDSAPDSGTARFRRR